MQLAQVPFPQVQEILESVTEHRRLTTVIRAMAREIERLEEENKQLQAAVEIYRAVVRRYAVHAV